jgi:hypothetical protein
VLPEIRRQIDVLQVNDYFIILRPSWIQVLWSHFRGIWWNVSLHFKKASRLRFSNLAFLKLFPGHRQILPRLRLWPGKVRNEGSIITALKMLCCVHHLAMQISFKKFKSSG